MQKNFGVAAGLKLRALRLQLCHQVGEIVDLAVENDGERAIRRVHRLDAARQIDESEPAVTERDAGRVIDTFAIGAAMGHRIRHRLNQGRIECPLPRTIEKAGQAAHQAVPRAAPAAGLVRIPAVIAPGRLCVR